MNKPVIDIFPATELGARDYSDWQAILSRMSGFVSPYFHPDFVAATACVVPQSFVARQTREGRREAFFAFQRRGDLLQPLATPLCDYQSVICAKDTVFDWAQLMAKANARTITMSALFNQGQNFDELPKVRRRFIDLNEGFDHWEEMRTNQDHKYFKNLRRIVRKFERELKDVRFDYGPVTPDVIDWVISIKTMQFKESGLHNVFGCGWTVDVFRQLARLEGNDFGLEASTIRINGALLAGIIYMRHKNQVHFWLTAFDPCHRAMSPGIVSIYQTIKHLSARGITMIDFGTGEESYKDHLTDYGEEALSLTIKKSDQTAFKQVPFEISGIGQRLNTITACERSLIGKARAYISLGERGFERILEKFKRAPLPK